MHGPYHSKDLWLKKDFYISITYVCAYEVGLPGNGADQEPGVPKREA
jgi:hypothetical protein